ncbi:helix-turn-helix transcriptional regulator [Herbaspirillum sp. ST 5-3]|uniref:helix-turn-helix domain-containing protein n=1 Tax=Oxalobacteraceae TaxID=75682 RepID=UPI0010A422C3|nr:helix-turn-helix transcriptional regulator [Herbaspirillum sp. ST 5-3]
MTSSVKQEPEWMAILRADVQATGSIADTARRIGVSRPAISQILNGIGPYGTGKSSTVRVAEKVMNTIGLIACPFLSQDRGTEYRITGLQCREYAYRTTPPTNSPRDMRHWRACQGCSKRVPAAAVATPETPKPARKIGKVGAVNNEIYCQQAGVIDKVTLPLPVVGGPQVEEEVV